MFEELDRPGEYYLDRQNNRLYFWPPTDVTTTTVRLTLCRQPLVRTDGSAYLSVREEVDPQWLDRMNNVEWPLAEFPKLFEGGTPTKLNPAYRLGKVIVSISDEWVASPYARVWSAGCGSRRAALVEAQLGTSGLGFPHRQRAPDRGYHGLAC